MRMRKIGSLILGGDYIINYQTNTGGANLEKELIRLILNKLLQVIQLKMASKLFVEGGT